MNTHLPSMFFLPLPDLRKLCCVMLTVQEEEEELRSTQMKTCRELVLLYSHILASPALDSFAEITVVMAVEFLQTGVLHAFGQRRQLLLGPPQRVFPGVLQCCFSYSLISRLSPGWNKAGLHLVCGRDFLSKRGRLDAVRMEMSTSEGHLCVSVEANAVRLPPTTLEDFGLPPLVLRRFCSELDSVIDTSSTGRAVWCHVLPSMKKGQIITISRKLPPDGPFKTYRDLQNHWKCLYGYRLPDLAEEEVVYCSVYFALVGERLFTYPLSCVRLQPVQCCPQVDQQGLLSSFLSDVSSRLPNVCGFPAQLTRERRYRTGAKTLQVLSGMEVNLTTTTSSTRLLLSQLPPPPPPLITPDFMSQPPSWSPLSQQDGVQGIRGNGCTFRNSLSRGCQGDEDWPSSSSSSAGSCTTSSLPLPQPSSSFSSSLPLLQPSSSFTSSSLSLPQPSSSFSSSLPLPQPSSSFSSLPLHQPSSSFTSSSLPLIQPSSFLTYCSSSVPSSLPASSQPPMALSSKLVPIFKNKRPSRHISVALLHLQKQRKQLSGGGGGSFQNKSAPIAAASSSAFLPTPAPPNVRCFSRRPKSPRAASHPEVDHLPSLTSRAPESRPGMTPALKLEIKFKPKSHPRTILRLSSERKTKVKEQP